MRQPLKPLMTVVRRMILIASLGWIAHSVEPACAQTNEAIRIVELVGTVEILPHGANTWVLTQARQPLHALDRVRTGTNSSVGLLWSDQSVLRFGALTELQILPPHADNADQGLHLFRGLLSFFHRDQPGRIRVITSGALAGIEGTEFVMEAITTNGVEQTTLSVIDGKVSFGNQHAALMLTNGQQALAEPGQAPRRTAGFVANNLLQWCFYYPAVLDLKDLSLPTKKEKILDDSLAAYRAGDLLTALAKYPEARQPDSDEERVYHAALLLSVGHVEQAEAILATLQQTAVADKNQRLAAALRTLIAAVKHEPRPTTHNPQLSTEFLAASYFEQSVGLREASLVKALAMAKQSVTRSPEFGFGWARVAELEFSFGRTARALEALNKSLELAPRNAQALALQGFLLAAQNKTSEAIDCFDRALAVDSTLGNAWLGRGLCRIRLGDHQAGREDLLVAAAMEPQRATLRSYLGKAWSDAGDDVRARKELGLAKKLDPKDPTSWLYSALNNEQHNRINEAIGDLEKSQELNENRSVYRSGLLLDQDQAVRSANLARIYAEAGMDDVALRAASRAVSSDYGNYSAHLFLADSYQQLRQSSPFDLRFETPAFSEYLMASLLGPVDGRILAPPVTQQEYTRLFEQDSFGFSSSTEYLSRGAWSQYAAQYGTYQNFSYALEADYQSDPGQTPNGHEETKLLSLKIKHMVTPSDGLYVQLLDSRQTSGDLSQRYDPRQADRGLNVDEKQEPAAIVGLDHKWSDTQHTLVLASYFNDSFQVKDPNGPTYLLADDPLGAFFPTDLTEKYESQLSVYSFEVQQLVRSEPLQTVAGIRFQYANNDLSNIQTLNANNAPGLEGYFGLLGTIITKQSPQVNSQRISPYLYEYWQVTDQLQLIGGISYDYQRQPNNALFAPLNDGEETLRQFSPKAALIWTLGTRTTMRAAYTESLGGVDLDQSVRLEPSQLAGFVQAYRTLFPDSLVGGIAGAKFQTADVSFEHVFPSRTYFAMSGQMLWSTANQDLGAFESSGAPVSSAAQVNEHLDFHEYSADTSLHQLLGDWFSVGARYRISKAELTQNYPQINPALGPLDPATLAPIAPSSSGLLQLVSLDGVFQHPSGIFARTQASWWSQNLYEGLSGMPGDSFWQLNFDVGYRSPRKHVEVTIGLLNVTGQNYHLSPINLYPDLPRERTLAIQLKLNF